MKKIIFTGIILFGLFAAGQADAQMTFGFSVEILKVTGITSDTGWTTIDLSAYTPWQLGIRALYLEMRTREYASQCPNGEIDDVFFEVKPFHNDPTDDTDIRRQGTETLDLNSGHSVYDYVWIPINSSNKLSYQVRDIACPNTKVNVRLLAVGYHQP